MPAMRPCKVCRVPTEGPRCPKHQVEHDAPRRAVYDSPAYRRMRARVISSHLATVGPWCPGYGVPGHVSHALTLDHLVPLAAGGEATDARNAGVLCRACNSRKRDRV
jgi:5-methylcytosine-specific restriction protein A